MTRTFSDFASDVIERSHSMPVLVDFWAPWCAPCRALGPILDRLAEENRTRFELAKINTEEQPEIAARYNVRSIPNVMLFVDGDVLDEFSGALPEAMIRDWLDRVLPSPLRERVGLAERCFAEGKAEEGEAILETVLAEEPGNDHAALLLGKSRLFRDPAQAAAVVANIGPGSDYHGEAEALRDLARLVSFSVRPEDLPEGAAKNLYANAACHLRNARFAEALEMFIEVVRIDRNYDGDGARKACIGMFKLLGDDHPLTREYRARLSGALYV